MRISNSATQTDHFHVGLVSAGRASFGWLISDRCDWPGRANVIASTSEAVLTRRADVRLYESVKSTLMAQGAELLHLSSSFRSPPSLQRFVNSAFARPIAADKEASGFSRNRDPSSASQNDSWAAF